jgi:hypothetical protein
MLRHPALYFLISEQASYHNKPHLRTFHLRPSNPKQRIMRLSIIAVVLLTALAENPGVDAKAISTNLALSRPAIPAPKSKGYELEYKTRRGDLPPFPLPKVPQSATPETVNSGENENSGGVSKSESRGLGTETPEVVTPSDPPEVLGDPSVVTPGYAKLKLWEKLIGRICTPSLEYQLQSVEDIMTHISDPTDNFFFWSGPVREGTATKRKPGRRRCQKEMTTPRWAARCYRIRFLRSTSKLKNNNRAVLHSGNSRR